MKVFTLDDPHEAAHLLCQHDDDKLLCGQLVRPLVVALLYDMDTYGSECLVVCDPRDNPRLFVHWYVCQERSALVVDFACRFGELNLTFVTYAFDFLHRIIQRDGLTLIGWAVPDHADFRSLLEISRRATGYQHGMRVNHRSFKCPVMQFLVRPENVPGILLSVLGDEPVSRR